MKHMKNADGDIITVENFSDFARSVNLPALAAIPLISADEEKVLDLAIHDEEAFRAACAGMGTLDHLKKEDKEK